MKILESVNILLSVIFLFLGGVIAFGQHLLPTWFWEHPPLTVAAVSAVLFAHASFAFATAASLYASHAFERVSTEEAHEYTYSLGVPGCMAFLLAVAFGLARPEQASTLPFFAAVFALGAFGLVLFSFAMALNTPWHEKLQQENLAPEKKTEV